MSAETEGPRVRMRASKARSTRKLSIHRSDRWNKREHGWSVRITRWGRTHTKYFADSVWGGRQAALTAFLDFEALARAEIEWLGVSAYKIGAQVGLAAASGF